MFLKNKRKWKFKKWDMKYLVQSILRYKHNPFLFVWIFFGFESIVIIILIYKRTMSCLTPHSEVVVLKEVLTLYPPLYWRVLGGRGISINVQLSGTHQYSFWASLEFIKFSYLKIASTVLMLNSYYHSLKKPALHQVWKTSVMIPGAFGFRNMPTVQIEPNRRVEKNGWLMMIHSFIRSKFKKTII